MTKESLQQEGLKKIKTDFRYLVALFKEMLRSIGEGEVADALALENSLTPDTNDRANEKLIQAPVEGIVHHETHFLI